MANHALTSLLVAATSLAPALAVAEGTQVYCKYDYYGRVYTMCAAPPIEHAKKDCEQRAKKQHEQKLTCWCTDDPDYIRDFCEEAGEQKPAP